VECIQELELEVLLSARVVVVGGGVVGAEEAGRAGDVVRGMVLLGHERIRNC
jgi:alanine dehydrogenase